MSIEILLGQKRLLIESVWLAIGFMTLDKRRIVF